MKRKHLSALSVAVLFSVHAMAQLSLFYNEQPLPLGQGSVAVFRDASHEHSLFRYPGLQPFFRPYRSNDSSFSYKDRMFWVRLDLSALPRKDSLAYLVISNPHINFLQVGFLQRDSFLKVFPPTGDHVLFRSRPVNHTDFVFPIPAAFRNAAGSIMILADKRHEQLTVPVHLFTEGGFLDYTASKNMLAGLVFGLSAFLFVFNLFLFWQMREALFVYYGLYILMVVVYIMTDYGYLFMYLFPEHPAPADYMRPLTISLATVLYVLFSFELTGLKSQMPAVYKWMRAGLLMFVVLLGVLLLLGASGASGIVVWQWIMQPVLSFFGAANLVVAIVAWKRKITWAPAIVATTLVLWVSTGLYGVYISGSLPDTLLTRNLLNLGFITDIGILAFVLSLRFKNYKQRSEELLRKTQVQEQQIFQSVTDYQERERQRLSSLLHDSIGARLSALRLTLESESKDSFGSKKEEALNGISELANEVRQFSHSLSPVLLQQKGVGKALQQYVDSINKSGKLYIQFEIIGSRSRASLRYELLVHNITHELIQNIIKHSGATEAIVQVLMEEEVVSIFAEDDGRGFDTGLVEEGLGFTQIRQLVTFVNGRLDVQSSPGNGTKISIEFFALPDARN